MDDQLARQLTRQLKVLNFWISLFGGIVLLTLIVIGVLVYKIVTFTDRTANQISDIKDKTTQTLNVQKKLCDTKNIGSILDKKTEICD